MSSFTIVNVPGTTEREAVEVVVSYDVGNVQCCCHAGADFKAFRCCPQNLLCGVIYPVKVFSNIAANSPVLNRHFRMMEARLACKLIATYTRVIGESDRALPLAHHPVGLLHSGSKRSSV
jgi:hypothetical protein